MGGNGGRRRDFAGFAGKLQRFDAIWRVNPKQEINGNCSLTSQIWPRKLLISRSVRLANVRLTSLIRIREVHFP